MKAMNMKTAAIALLCLLAAASLRPAYAQEDGAAAEQAPAIRFDLAPEDVASWSQVKDGKFIELNVSDEKRKEINALTASGIGRPLDILFAGAVIHAGVIKEPLKAENGFVLVPQEDQRKALLGLLDPAKEKKKAPAHLGLGAKGGTETEKAEDVKPTP